MFDQALSTVEIALMSRFPVVESDLDDVELEAARLFGELDLVVKVGLELHLSDTGITFRDTLECVRMEQRFGRPIDEYGESWLARYNQTFQRVSSAAGVSQFNSPDGITTAAPVSVERVEKKVDSWQVLIQVPAEKAYVWGVLKAHPELTLEYKSAQFLADRTIEAIRDQADDPLHAIGDAIEVALDRGASFDGIAAYVDQRLHEAANANPEENTDG